jgi:hypothetical protein
MTSADLRDGLQAVELFLRRFTIFPSDDSYTAAALWVAHDHLFTDEWPEITPYLLFDKPGKRCGGSRSLDALEPMLRDPWRIDAAPTASVLFRKLADGEVTMLIDELDQVFRRGSENGDLTGVLNAGWRRGAIIPRTNVKSHEAEDHSAFAPKILAGIDASRWSSTIVDRSIRIRLRRKRKSEQVERWRHRVHFAEGEKIAEQLAALAPLGEEAAKVEIPELYEIDDRAMDCWEPLLQVAEVAGGDWPDRARIAAISLSSGRLEDDDLGILLLRDVREVLAAEQSITSSELVQKLQKLEESPWREYGGAGLTPMKLARLLAPFEIRSRNIRRGAVAKGYSAEDFTDAFDRYLLPSRQDATSLSRSGEDVASRSDGRGEGGLPELQETVQAATSIEREAGS